MKRKMMTACLAVLLVFLCNQARAYDVNINWDNNYRTGQGGEFSFSPLQVSSIKNLIGNYSSDAIITINGKTYYQTFCIEHNEIINKGDYYASIAPYAINGGVGGATDNKDAISIGTAYLYSQFARGTLDGYNYIPGSGRQTSAGKLQEAFWWLENEISLVSPGNNEFILQAWNALYLGQKFDDTLLRADSDGAYGVRALNIWNDKYDPTEPDQTQLTLVPEPGTLLMIGASLMGLALIRRRKR